MYELNPTTADSSSSADDASRPASAGSNGVFVLSASQRWHMQQMRHMTPNPPGRSLAPAVTPPASSSSSSSSSDGTATNSVSAKKKKTNSVASGGAVRHAKCLNRMETLAKMETAFVVAAAVNNSGTKREERSPSTNSNRDIAAYSGPSTKISARNKRLKTNLNSFVGSLKEMYEDEVERVKKEHENEKAALKAELQSKTEEIEALKDEVREQATKITELEATASFDGNGTSS